LPAFEKQIKGFSMHDAILTGIETRTSSPLAHDPRRLDAEPQRQGPVPGG
jgi:uncharacterized FAD-dependent dehydrogenase